MTELLPNTRIVVAQKHLHNSNYDIISGELISIEGNMAVVELENEGILRKVPVASVSAADSLLGALTERSNEAPVLDRLPKR
jgi:hypothetical protein